MVQIPSTQTWQTTIKLQSQTTFNGKESENIENWSSLLVLNFELVKLHSDAILPQRTKALNFILKLTQELKKVTGLAEPKSLEEAIRFARNFDA